MTHSIKSVSACYVVYWMRLLLCRYFYRPLTSVQWLAPTSFEHYSMQRLLISGNFPRPAYSSAYLFQLKVPRICCPPELLGPRKASSPQRLNSSASSSLSVSSIASVAAAESVSETQDLEKCSLPTTTLPVVESSICYPFSTPPIDMLPDYNGAIGKLDVVRRLDIPHEIRCTYFENT